MKKEKETSRHLWLLRKNHVSAGQARLTHSVCACSTSTKQYPKQHMSKRERISLSSSSSSFIIQLLLLFCACRARLAKSRWDVTCTTDTKYGRYKHVVRLRQRRGTGTCIEFLVFVFSQELQRGHEEEQEEANRAIVCCREETITTEKRRTKMECRKIVNAGERPECSAADGLWSTATLSVVNRVPSYLSSAHRTERRRTPTIFCSPLPTLKAFFDSRLRHQRMGKRTSHSWTCSSSPSRNGMNACEKRGLLSRRLVIWHRSGPSGRVNIYSCGPGRLPLTFPNSCFYILSFTGARLSSAAVGRDKTENKRACCPAS